ncbi:MAG: hypothetical protein Pg6C_01310 [Treponemataceae bacterium]|nr:MAG: hypothetical protein Pg6C_01310 [Treponemataceae bacterium]
MPQAAHWLNLFTILHSTSRQPCKLHPALFAGEFLVGGLAVFSIENSAVVIDDRLTGRREQLRHGSQVDLGRVSVIVNSKSS